MLKVTTKDSILQIIVNYTVTTYVIICCNKVGKNLFYCKNEYDNRNMNESVRSNANPLHYYVLRVPRKANRWR